MYADSIDLYNGDDSSGDNASIVSSLIGAATSLGTTAIVATQTPGAIAPASYIPQAGNALPQIAATNAQAKSSTLIIVVILAIVAFFAFDRMKR